MPFITDLNLVRLEPNAFVDAQSAGTELESGADGQVISTTFSSQSSKFVTRGVAPGSVVVMGGEAYEVVTVIDETSMTVSRPRSGDSDPIVPPPAGSGLSFTVITFGRIIDQVESWALGRLGLDLVEDGLDESVVLNPSPLERLLSAWAVRRIFESAAAHAPTDDSLAERAALYRSLTTQLTGQTEVQLDLDDDGETDAVRRFDVLTMHRS